jgi:hypothetical protein
VPNEPTHFRDQLLDAQRTTPELREEYRRELAAIVTQKLTPRKRAETWLWLIASVAFAAWCGFGLIRHHDKTVPLIVLPVFIVFAAAHAVWLARALHRGEFAWRSNFKLLETWTFASGVVLTVALFRGMRAPADPASTFGLLFAFIFYACCAGMSLQNQFRSAAMTTREQMLRLESRLADLADRLGK